MSATSATALAPPRAKLIPVVEIFGPTIQGEGAEAGVPTHFIRVGGCDYRCVWCDTMYAVDPEIVRTTSERLSSQDIVNRVTSLDGRPIWTTISGGNPALHELGELVAGLHAAAFRVSVETQGSLWKPWLGEVDRLTISPKPPSSGMVSSRHDEQLRGFMAAALDACAARAVLKVVVFDEIDLEWASDMARLWPDLPLYLSAGTPVPADADVRDVVGDRYRWLCEEVGARPNLADVRVLPQLHVIAWKGATGV
jgi:7-carboxy-7-deazaguanine synthase